MLHIYTGNGKGKTTSAIGIAVRAAGAGLAVCFMQFLKNGNSSEIAMLKKLNIMTMCAECCNKFTFQMNKEELSALAERHDEQLSAAEKLIAGGTVQLLVFDEVIAAYNSGLLDRALLLRVIDAAGAAGCEIILTGRDAPPELSEKADYLTYMQEVSHPYKKGISARKGIEY